MEDKKRYTTERRLVEVSPVKTEGFILDIGGGGEGIIGKLNGKHVIAVDTVERELEETHNEALKIIMDATDLKFLPNSFGVCTAFFSRMYMSPENQPRVLNEVHRVLKDDGKFLLWDVKIPQNLENYDAFVVSLKVRLPNEDIDTGYGVLWNKVQGIEYFKELAQKTKFKIVDEWSKDELFHLEMQKIL